jgi:SPP1 family phage portal protein
MIDELINDHAQIADSTKLEWERYLASKTGVPIKTRQMPDYSKVNNKIANDFVGEIVDTKVGYFAGIPINYEIDKTKYEKKKEGMLQKLYDAFVKSNNQQYIEHADYIENFVTRSNLHDLDAEMTKLLAACGVAGRKLYIDNEGLERVVNIKPWKIIFLLNANKEVEYALIYYPELNNNKELVTKVEFYDSDNITYFVENTDKNTSNEFKYVLDSEYIVNPIEHTFDFCPVVLYENNEEQQSDCHKVIDIIDNYDRAFSDMSSEIEQFRLAYMFFKGEEPSEEIMQVALQTGAFGIDVTSEVGFIAKNLDPSFNNAFLDRSEDNIQRFAKHVNFMDENFAGQATGIALKYKLQALSNKCITLESKFKTSSRYMFKILCSSWAKRKVVIDYLSIFYTFKRNLPTDYEYEAKVSQLLKGNISERTRLGLFSFIDDVDYELEEMKKDAEAYSTEFTNPNANVDDQFNMNNLGDDNAAETI